MVFVVFQICLLGLDVEPTRDNRRTHGRSGQVVKYPSLCDFLVEVLLTSKVLISSYCYYFILKIREKNRRDTSKDLPHVSGLPSSSLSKDSTLGS